jgi:hypothetical protein
MHINFQIWVWFICIHEATEEIQETHWWLWKILWGHWPHPLLSDYNRGENQARHGAMPWQKWENDTYTCPFVITTFESGMWQCFLKKQWNGKVPFHSGMLNRAGHVWRVSEEMDIGWWNQVFRGHMHQQVLGHCEFNKLSQMTDPW